MLSVIILNVIVQSADMLYVVVPLSQPPTLLKDFVNSNPGLHSLLGINTTLS